MYGYTMVYLFQNTMVYHGILPWNMMDIFIRDESSFCKKIVLIVLKQYPRYKYSRSPNIMLITCILDILDLFTCICRILGLVM